MEPLLAHYLSIQKQKDLFDMDDREVRGRWKSFVGKWNRGELAEGWYDPEMFARIASDYQGREWENGLPPLEDEVDRARRQVSEVKGNSSAEDDDDEYGPILPTDSGRRMNVSVPSMDDIAHRDELNQEDREAQRQALRDARKADRALQKERLEDIAPRAEAGTRERQLEKRQMVNDKMRTFRDRSPNGAMEAGDEKELMGGGDSVEEYKRAKEQEKRRKTEREIRREEIDRAKREEMEKRRQAWVEREEATVSMLRDLARQQFGPK